MGWSADRASGAFFFLFGLALLFIVHPNYIETPDGGSISPERVPNIIAMVIAGGGALLVFKPTEHQMRDPRAMAITGLYVGVLVLGLYAMSWLGFEIVGPLLAFVIMWFIGERRPLWLILGVVVMPALIWFLVTEVLGRALP